jgi:hypothetical protein
LVEIDLPPPPLPPFQRAVEAEPERGLLIAERALGWLARQPDRSDAEGAWRWDCSGFALRVLADAGYGFIPNTNAAGLKQLADGWGTFSRTQGRVGDLAFFDDTYDRDGRPGVRDPVTHVAVVVGTDASTGTMRLVHLFGASADRISEFSMNLNHPSEARGPDGERLNGLLSTHGAYGRLAGELSSGFASFWMLENPQAGGVK